MDKYDDKAREIVDEVVRKHGDFYVTPTTLTTVTAILRACDEMRADAPVAPPAAAPQPERELTEAERDDLGRVVRDVWIAWALEQTQPKSSWLMPWDGMSEADREVDRRIGERLFAMGRSAERGLAAIRSRTAPPPPAAQSPGEGQPAPTVDLLDRMANALRTAIEMGEDGVVADPYRMGKWRALLAEFDTLDDEHRRRGMAAIGGDK